MNSKHVKIDLHVHSNISPCSNMHFDDILHHARLAGLDGLGITDHDTMCLNQTVNDGIQKNGVYVFIGMEYSTPQGDFLLFGPFRKVPLNLEASALLTWVAHQDGIAIAAHPCRANRTTDKNLIKDGACQIIEGLNGRNSITENLKAVTYMEKYGAQLTGGSDAHKTDEIGNCYTRFDAPVRNSVELVQALKTGRFQPEKSRHHPFSANPTSACQIPRQYASL